MADYVVLLSADPEPEPEPEESSIEEILISIDNHIQQLDTHVQELDTHLELLDSDFLDFVDSQASFDSATLSYLQLFMISFFTVLAIMYCLKIGKWIENLICDR